MIEQLTRYIKTHQLFIEKSTLIVGVSGGVDSMVLLDLLRQLSASWHLNLIIAHFNYKLRGKDSDLDEDLVRTYCETYDITFEHAAIDTQSVAVNEKMGIQETARKLRYRWFDQLLQKHKADRIVLAHHSDDNVETILFHLSKGTGISGLRGMKPKNEMNVVRPFLALTKEQIITYARDHQIIWREDESNQKTDYTRNLIRLKVLPILKQINPSLSDHFDETHSRLLGLEQLVINQLSDLKNKYHSSSDGIEKWETGWVSENELSLMLLSEIVKPFGFGFRDAQDIYEAILHPQGQLFDTEGYRLNVNGAFFLIESRQDDFEEAAMPILNGEKLINYNSYTYSLQYLKVDQIKITADTSKAYLDLEKVKFPLTLRKWEKGDRMQPYGMHGRKKVSDILIDDKIPNIQKDKTHVLLSGEDIIWLSGVRVAHVARVTNETEDVLLITRH